MLVVLGFYCHGGVTLSNPKPFPRGDSCLEELVIQAATQARARGKRQAGKTTCQPASFPSGIQILVLDIFSRTPAGALLPTHQHSNAQNGRKGSVFGKMPCLPPLQVWVDGGAPGCQEEDPEVEMGNPLEIDGPAAAISGEAPVFCCQSIPPEEGGEPCLPAG